MNRIKELPTPLKAVVWLNIVPGILSLVIAIAYSTILPSSLNVAYFIAAALNGLIILGILQASKFIRAIVLLLSFLSVAVLGLELINGLFSINVRALVILIPFAVNCVTIWGLCVGPSEAYFYEGKYPKKQKMEKERKRIGDYIQVGMDEHQARKVLAPYFLKVSEESITDRDYGACNVLRYSDRRLSADLWLVYVAGGVVKAYK